MSEALAAEGDITQKLNKTHQILRDDRPTMAAVKVERDCRPHSTALFNKSNQVPRVSNDLTYLEEEAWRSFTKKKTFHFRRKDLSGNGLSTGREGGASAWMVG